MTKHVDLIAVEDTVAVVIPQDVAERLGLRPGGTLSFDERSDTIELKPSETELDRQMAVMREVMTRHRRALSELAK